MTASRPRLGRVALVVALVVAVGLALLAALALRPAPDLREERATLYVFGTLVEVVIRGQDAATARAAIADVGQALQRLHTDWHAWRPGALGDVNAAIAAGGAAPVDPDLAAVLRTGQRLACESGGVFDPAIGGLVALWGFHADTPREGAPPDGVAVAQLVGARPRMADLELVDHEVRSANAAVQLDLGGYAKGAALDRAASLLQARGIHNAVLNAGGDVNVLGAHGARPWRVAIRDPFEWGALAAVSLEPGEVLYTSGNYERYFDHGGVRFSHIIDPRTGAPVREIVSVSVLGTNGAEADAAATALSVAGPDAWAEVAQAMGVTSVLMITGDGAIYATPTMAERLEPVAGAAPLAPEVVALPQTATDRRATCAAG